MSEIIVSDALQMSKINTPTREGELVQSVKDINNIINPRMGMIVYVENEKKNYIITELKETEIGGVTVSNAAVKSYEPLDKHATDQIMGVSESIAIETLRAKEAEQKLGDNIATLVGNVPVDVITAIQNINNWLSSEDEASKVLIDKVTANEESINKNEESINKNEESINKIKGTVSATFDFTTGSTANWTSRIFAYKFKAGNRYLLRVLTEDTTSTTYFSFRQDNNAIQNNLLTGTGKRENVFTCTANCNNLYMTIESNGAAVAYDVEIQNLSEVSLGVLERSLQRLKDDILGSKGVSLNLEFTEGTYWDFDKRTYGTNASYKASAPIQLSANEILIVNGQGGSLASRLVAVYDANKNLVYTSKPEAEQDVVLSSSDLTVYITTTKNSNVDIFKTEYSILSQLLKSIADISDYGNTLKTEIDNIKKSSTKTVSYGVDSLQVPYYYALGKLSVGDVMPNPSHYDGTPQWGCVKIYTPSKSTVILKTVGGTNGRAYALVDSQGCITSISEENLNTLSNPLFLNIEKDGYILVNVKDATIEGFSVEVSSSLTNTVENLSERVEVLESNTVSTAKMYNPVVNLNKEQLRVLDIGNSYSVDSTHYLEGLSNSAGLTLSDMCLYSAFRAGGSFKNWVDIYNDNDTSSYSISKKIGGLSADINGVAAAGNGEKFRNTLANNEWDLIVIHQASQYAPYYQQWEGNGEGGYLNELIRIIRKHQPRATIGFLLIHSYWSGYSGNTEKSSYERWKLIADSTKKIQSQYNIDFVIPYGTAIQNLRASSLNTEHELSNDGTHCADGLGDYCASCCYFQSLLAPRYNKSVLGNGFRVSIEPSGTYPDSVVSVTDDNALMAQKAAFIATYNWYECINPENITI